MYKSFLNFLSAFVFLFSGIVLAQSPNEILLTINDEAITVDAFKRVYLKNLDLVQDDNQKDVISYLELFKEYKLKVQEAYRLKLDERESYKKGLEGYQRQLSKNYMTDIEVTDALIKEAYDRIQEEVEARHILVKIEGSNAPSDTLAAYTKIMEAREKILNGEDFSTVAKQYSTDPSAARNGGDLGWFTAFKMVYPFETAAFETAVGDISMPFRTRYGYHIVQTTNRRKAGGEVTAAHIMIALKQSDSTILPEKRINEIYGLLNNGTPFEKLARTYSDDKKTGRKGGLLAPFSKGQLSSPLFEEKVFSLSEENPISKPFKTDFGWHIAKLISKKPIGTFEQERYELETKVKRDSRAQVISDSLYIKLRRNYNIQVSPEVVSFFENLVTDDILKGSWKFDTDASGLDKEAIKLQDTRYTYKDIGKYLEQTQLRSRPYPTKAAFVEDKINDFYNFKVRDYHQEHLEEQDPEFAAVLSEYKEGLLLFDLMQNTVWNQAKTDTIGLERYYESHKENYAWSERAEVITVTSPQRSILEEVKSLLNQGTSREAIESKMEGKGNVFFTKSVIAVDDAAFAKAYTPHLGVSDIYEKDGFVLYNVLNLLPARLKTLDEARGQVSSDFQKQVEKEWIAGLKKDASVKVNKKVLKKLIKSLQ